MVTRGSCNIPHGRGHAKKLFNETFVSGKWDCGFTDRVVVAGTADVLIVVQSEASGLLWS